MTRSLSQRPLKPPRRGHDLEVENLLAYHVLLELRLRVHPGSCLPSAPSLEASIWTSLNSPCSVPAQAQSSIVTLPAEAWIMASSGTAAETLIACSWLPRSSLWSRMLEHQGSRWWKPLCKLSENLGTSAVSASNLQYKVAQAAVRGAIRGGQQGQFPSCKL